MGPNGFQNIPNDELQQLKAQVATLQTVLQMRSTIMFGQILDALNIRRQQALAGDAQARSELLAFLNAIDPARLRAAAMGITAE